MPRQGPRGTGPLAFNWLGEEDRQPEAFSLAARLGGIAWRRPMTYQFVAALVQAFGGRVRQVRIDRVVAETYIATVEVEGPPDVQPVDARPSDALNLSALVQAPIFVAPEVLQEAETRCAGDSPAATRLRRALASPLPGESTAVDVQGEVNVV